MLIIDVYFHSDQIKLETGNEWKPSEYLPWSGKMKYFVNSVDDHVKSDSDNYDKFVDSDGISVKYRGFSPNFQIKDAILKSTNDFPSGSWRRWKSAFLDEYPVKKFKSIRPISPAALLTGTRFKLYNQNHNQFGQDKASSSFPSTSMDLQKMLSKISPDEKGCKTIVKEIHESPGNEPQKIIRVIRNRRIDDDYRKSANKKGITLLMFKHCVEPNQTADSPNSISMKPILSTEQFNFEDSLKSKQIKLITYLTYLNKLKVDKLLFYSHFLVKRQPNSLHKSMKTRKNLMRFRGTNSPIVATVNKSWH